MSLDPIKKQQNTQLDSASASNSANKNLDAEAEYVPLPSQGIYYTGIYKGMTQLKVRKLNWEDEDILTTKSYYDNGTLFNEILKNCIVDENGFKAEWLVDVDKNAILWWLRIGAFGQEYTIPHECVNPECKHKTQITWDLGSFEMPDFSKEYEAELTEKGLITVELPISKLRVSISIPSIGRELEIQKRLKNRKQKSNATKDFNITGKLISVIKEAYSADGSKTYKDFDSIQEWLRTGFGGSPIPLVDSRFIQKVARDIELKVDTKKDIVCTSCGHTEEGVDMPMSIYFFWPEYASI